MANPTQPKPHSKPVAVIRSYQPVRIERDLLAQVFDLAERGLPGGHGATDRPGFNAASVDAQRGDASSGESGRSFTERRELFSR